MTAVKDEAPAGRRPVTDPRVERSRASVLAAATELLLEGGPAAVTIDAIVERSGVARTTIYRHWPNRTAVLTAAFAEVIPEIPEPDRDVGAEAGLRQVMHRFADELSSAPWVGVIPAFMESARHDTELRKLFEQFVQAREAPFAAAVQHAVDDGLLPANTDIDEAVLQLAGPLVFGRLLLMRGESGHAFADRLVDLLLASRS